MPAAKLPLDPHVSGLASALAWLRDHDVRPSRVASQLEISQKYARQLVFRGNWQVRQSRILPIFEDALRPPADPFGAVSDELRRRLKIRPKMDSWTVTLRPAARTCLDDLEERVEQLGVEFWSGVRHGVGVGRLREILEDVGRPAHFRRIRILARIRQLLAETYAHVGYSRSAIEQALTSLLLSRTAYEESQDPHDLEQFARTALIVSQSHLLRQEPVRATHYLDLHMGARSRIGQPLGGEYFRQRGIVAFQSGKQADDEALRNFTRAMTVLAETVEYGRPRQEHEVLNIGTRQMNLLGKVNWDGSRELVQHMLAKLPPGDIHICMNVNWAAACGFCIGIPQADREASKLLDRYRETTAGFGHQATIAWLLSLSPVVPAKHRADWVRRALYENVFKNE